MASSFNTQEGGWKSDLILNGNNAPKALLANATLALRSALEWQGVLGFNAFSLMTTAVQDTPWGGHAPYEWTDVDDMRTAEWLQREGIHVPVQIAAQAVQAVSNENNFTRWRITSMGLYGITSIGPKIGSRFISEPKTTPTLAL